MRFDGRVAIVTGGGRGIGRATARALASEGAKVVALDSDPLERKSETAIECVEADVRRVEDVQRVVRSVERRYGRIDILVNCAAIYPLKEWRTMDLVDWDRVMRVNVDGVFLMTRSCSEIMISGGYGRIVNIVSDAMLSGAPGMTHYVASKGAVWTLTRSLARELGEYGITANAVAPGLTETEGVMASSHRDAFDFVEARQCIPRRGRTDDIVPAILFLAAEESRWVTGQLLVCDGGMTHS